MESPNTAIFLPEPKYNPHPRSRDAFTGGALVDPTGAQASPTEYKYYTNEHRLLHSAGRVSPHSSRCHGFVNPVPVCPRLYLILTRIISAVHNIHSCTRSQRSKCWSGSALVLSSGRYFPFFYWRLYFFCTTVQSNCTFLSTTFLSYFID